MTKRPSPIHAEPNRDETLETSRLLVEFLHASYATRRLDQEETGPVRFGETSGQGPSAHAIRASIHVYQHGDRTVSQLAQGLGISLGWASRVADELVDRGHAVRERDPNDRRVVRLRMTEAALAEIERAYRWRGDAVARALTDHSPEERTAIRAFLRRVTDELTSEAAKRQGAAAASPAAPAAEVSGAEVSGAEVSGAEVSGAEEEGA